MKNLWTLMSSFIRIAFAIWTSFFQSVARMLGMMSPDYTSATASIPDPAADIARRLEGLDEREGFVPPAVGVAVHAYASAPDSYERSFVDLSALSAEQVLWLTGLGNADLEKLARVGAKGCAKAAEGKFSGVVGLPRPAWKDSMGRVLEKDSQSDTGHEYFPSPRPSFGM